MQDRDGQAEKTAELGNTDDELACRIELAPRADRKPQQRERQPPQTRTKKPTRSRAQDAGTQSNNRQTQ